MAMCVSAHSYFQFSSVQFKRFFNFNSQIKTHITGKHYTVIVTMLYELNKNVKERVNFTNFKRKLESVYFDRSYQNRAFRYFKFSQCLLNTVFCKWGTLGYCGNGRGVTYINKLHFLFWYQ